MWHTTSTLYNATYHVLILSLDRVLAILLPFRYRALNYPRVSRYASLGVTVATSVLTSPILLVVDVDPYINLCATLRGEQFMDYHRLVVHVGFPALVLIGSNIIFIWALIKRRERNKSGKRRRETSSKATVEAGEADYIRMLILTSVSFLLLLLTSTILVNVAERFISAGSYKLAQLMWACAKIPYAANNSLNFGFYYISGPMFREAFAKAFSKLGCRKQENVLSGRTAVAAKEKTVESLEMQQQKQL